MRTQKVQNQIETLSIRDKDYPTNLKYIFDPPQTLYIKGRMIPEDNIAIAIVGSRRASSYGLKNAQDLSFQLASKGITIISGLARGVDSAAHRAALQAGGRTIAVLGSGLNKLYPSENKELSEQVAKAGAVISEFPMETPPYRQNFPRRNRIISGLSLGVVVVEAARKSGALITANLGLEQGREIFAFPGKIDSLTSCGTHGLIKEGAKLVESSEDVIEELEALKFLQINQPESRTKTEVELDLPEEEKHIYVCLGCEPLHIDQIIQRSNFSYGKLLTSLLRLQHRRLVKELPGKLFVKAG
ncbi:MAG: DNA-protecting protein DprA [Candidatus Omnitrophica bacterium]|nr:DNA-protecting protein DprA [Candidatus Omnitrophota bacterium]